MLTEIEQKQLTNAALELERILATVKQWPWMDRREYPPQKRPDRLTPEMATTLKRGREIVNYGYTLLLHRSDRPRMYLNVIDESEDESWLIHYGWALLALLKRARFLPGRTGYSILPRRKAR